MSDIGRRQKGRGHRNRVQAETDVPFGCKRSSELPGVRVKRETGFGPIPLGASGETRGGLGRLSSPLLGFGFKMRDRERKEMT